MPEEQKDGGEVYPNGSWGGITRRDWLAGLAMQGMQSNVEGYANLTNENAAELAYKLADAMIAESNK